MNKTTHFHLRAWERKIDQYKINLLLKNIKVSKTKTLLIFSKAKLKEIGLKEFKNSNLIIVVKENVLITLFEVKDLFYYLKSLNNSEIKIIN